MSEFSRETLLNIIETDHVQCGEASALARMALVAMGSEPVAFTDERNLGYIDRGRETAYLWGKQNSEASDVALYRHAQPAPVVPEEKLTPNTLSMYAVDAVAAIAEVKGWNACRAAMLQAEPVCTCPSGDGSLRWPCPVHAGSSPAIPDGYVMVPVKPTREILDEFDSIIDYGAEDSEDAWRRLLAAAPQEVKGE
ncbi:TPA: hypothetical protein ACF6V1_001640 [Klebsiella pneumoniae]